MENKIIKSYTFQEIKKLFAEQDGKKPVFLDKNLFSFLKVRMKFWNGAKYSHMGITTGGIDCTKLVAVLFMEMGIFTGIDQNLYYPTDWYLHSKEEIAINGLVDHCNKYLVQDYSYYILDFEEKELIDGDIVFFAMKKNTPCHHTGIYCSENKMMFHAINQSGVCFVHWDIFWTQRARKIIRIIN